MSFGHITKSAALPASEQKPVVLPFAILDQEMADLLRFHECAMDDEGYDVPKDRMKRLAEIGLLRRVSARYYEHTAFGLAVINGDFNSPDGADRITELEAEVERSQFPAGVKTCADNSMSAELVALEVDNAALKEKLRVAREAIAANHSWHLTYDEYGGYEESDLCEINTTALASVQEGAAK